MGSFFHAFALGFDHEVLYCEFLAVQAQKRQKATFLRLVLLEPRIYLRSQIEI